MRYRQGPYALGRLRSAAVTRVLPPPSTKLKERMIWKGEELWTDTIARRWYAFGLVQAKTATSARFTRDPNR